ncbi:hypothetical protein ASPCAL05233 [Aspergillus calidoustus]|uniref:Zn(2)-C6 fungal-type domain-containing protein n=1 Tax=Aspergillus calidoustus TaxID=454130 RepID=A0A0U4Z367_ASPCI|nr:hypothetical protein ASPCAL05233 [Aspergillus calidoustus]
MPNPKSRRIAPVASDTAANNDTQKRRKNVGTACLACKTRKLKCTGAPPCANCVKSRLECNLDESADKRRRGPLKRKIDHLEDKEEVFLRLLEIIRDGDNRRIVPLLNLIRSHASLSEIRFYIEHQLPRSELPQASDLADLFRDIRQYDLLEPSPKRRMLGTPQPVDIPRFSVPARPWTSVITDDDLVSRLITLWFTWIHPTCNWIDRDLFIRDMKSGSLSAPYCSPFLVNVILADACAYADYAAYELPDELLVTQRSLLYDEAKRLLHKEEGRICLQTVQGLGVLWLNACVTGKDRLGWISRGQLAYSLEELSQTASHNTSDPDSTRMLQVVNHTKWGLFHLSLINGLFLKKVPILKPPMQHIPLPVDHQSDQDIWSSYPNPSKGVAGHTNCLSNALSNLNGIAYSLVAFLFPHSESSVGHIELDNGKIEALQALSAWPGRLPNCLIESKRDVPHVLSLHMHYHNVMIAIYGFLRTRPAYASTGSAWSPEPRIPFIAPQQAWEACLLSARKIAQLVVVHRSSWGFDRMPGANAPCIMGALFVLLEVLDEPANRDAFISLTVAAGAFSRRWECPRAVFRSLQNTARERGITLPPESGPIFMDLDQLSEKSTPVKSETPEAPTI